MLMVGTLMLYLLSIDFVLLQIAGNLHSKEKSIKNFQFEVYFINHIIRPVRIEGNEAVKQEKLSNL